MKTFVVMSALIVAVIGQAMPPEEMKKFVAWSGECREETKISAGLSTGLLAGKYPDDPIVGQFALCIGKKSGFQDADGNIQPNVVKQFLSSYVDPAKVDEIIRDCSVNKETPEKTAVAAGKCTFEKLHS